MKCGLQIANFQVGRLQIPNLFFRWAANLFIRWATNHYLVFVLVLPVFNHEIYQIFSKSLHPPTKTPQLGHKSVTLTLDGLQIANVYTGSLPIVIILNCWLIYPKKFVVYFIILMFWLRWISVSRCNCF